MVSVIPRIVLSNDVKSFIRRNRHPKVPFWAALIGTHKKGNYLVNSVVPVVYNTVCPHNKRPLKGVSNVLGIIHSHPNGQTLPSTDDLERAPRNMIHIILGSGEPGYWFKKDHYLLEVKI